jgi:ubiquinone/menaquinone biosynthesis C-methylase UbiE
VVAVDLLEGMVEQTRERARAAGVANQIQLAVADARRLPFAAGVFDAVIMESLNVFFQDKQGAMNNYVRVVKPGGYVSITEMTWLNPPSPEQAAYYKRTVYADALQRGDWMALLEGAGLQDVVGHVRAVDIPREGRQRIERYGCRGFLRVLVNTVRTILRDRASRDFLASVTRSLPQDMVSDVGYGVYAGRKPR